ncbi:MAG: SDR family oxidoreductase [Chlamydiales bacterium]|nr:SDR family oxidoreductase [Chlamydiales bacterium]
MLWQRGPHELWATTTTKEKLKALDKIAAEAILLDGSQQDLLTKTLSACDGIIISVAPGKDQSYLNTYLQTAHHIKISLSERTVPFYILYTSSTSVYGDQKGNAVDENTPLNPLTENSRILSETESVYLSCQSAVVDVCIFRLGGIYGPNRELTNRAKWMTGRDLPGSGNFPTNHSHRDDIVKAIDFALEKRLTGIYNIVGDEHPTRQELYVTLCSQQNLPPPKWTGSGPSLHGTNAIVSNAKIKKQGFFFTEKIF